MSEAACSIMCGNLTPLFPSPWGDGPRFREQLQRPKYTFFTILLRWAACLFAKMAQDNPGMASKMSEAGPILKSHGLEMAQRWLKGGLEPPKDAPERQNLKTIKKAHRIRMMVVFSPVRSPVNLRVLGHGASRKAQKGPKLPPGCSKRALTDWGRFLLRFGKRASTHYP